MVANILDMEGAEGGVWDELSRAGWSRATTNATVSSAWAHKSNGYGGTYAIRLGHTVGTYVQSPPYTPATAYGVQFTAYVDHATPSGDLYVEFYRSSTVTFSFTMTLLGGAVNYRRGDRNATSVASAAPATDWVQTAHTIRIRLVCADAGGTAELFIDGVSQGTYTGDTKAHTSTADWDQIRFGVSAGMTTYFDDIIIMDSTSTGDLGGEAFIVPRFPNATATSTFTGGTTGYTYVDEVPVSTSDYSEALLTTERERYTAAAMAFTGTSYPAVKLYSNCSRDGTITQAVAEIESNASVYQGTAVTLPAAGSWGLATALWLVDPDDTNPWDQSKIEALEFGQQFI